jgi:hypothetical protein
MVCSEVVDRVHETGDPDHAIDHPAIILVHVTKIMSELEKFNNQKAAGSMSGGREILRSTLIFTC